MKLTEFKTKIDLYANSVKHYNDPEVVVQYRPPFTTAGGTPCVVVTGVSMGFDWDSGKFFVMTEEPLTLVNGEFTEKFKKLQEDYRCIQYENRNLKAEIKKLKAQIK